MKKRILILLAALTLLLSACAKQAAPVSVYDLNNAMAAAADFEEMRYASSADTDAAAILANVTDFDIDKLESFSIYYAADGTGNADEIAVLQVKRPADLQGAKAALQDHLEKRKSLYATYDKSQLGKLDNARVVTSGNCAALIVATDAEKVSEAFYTFMKQ